MGLYQDILESADGGAFINLRDAAGNGITSTAVSGKQALDVNVANAISVGIIDKTTFTYGTTTFLPVGGVFQDTAPTLTAGQSGSSRLTANRGLHVNLRSAAGNELGDANSDGLFVKPGDGTNVQSYTASGEAKTLDTNSAAILAFMKSATGTITTPTVTTGSTTALVSNANRKRFSVFNTTTFKIYFAVAATATASAFTFAVNPNTLYEAPAAPIYTGIVTMISPAVTGTPTVAVTEYT